jgi:hypothetical protein
MGHSCAVAPVAQQWVITRSESKDITATRSSIDRVEPIGPAARPVLVIHGVAQRDRDVYEQEVAALGDALGPRVRLVPVYWGDFARSADSVDRVLPYLDWASSAGDDLGEIESSSLRVAFAERDMAQAFGSLTSGWKRRSASSRRKVIGVFYAMIRRQYLRASAQFTGDLILYQRRKVELQAVIWETIMRHAPGYGLKERPVDVIAHSLGATMMFDLAVEGHPALHIDHLITCASQTAFFHAIGASPSPLDQADPGDPVTLPPTIRSWANHYVPLDPWAFLTAPVFRLHDGSEPDDIEVYAGERGDRILTHAASHYWTHPVVLDTIRRELGLPSPKPVLGSLQPTPTTDEEVT